jgi:hypothetical protein
MKGERGFLGMSSGLRGVDYGQNVSRDLAENCKRGRVCICLNDLRCTRKCVIFVSVLTSILCIEVPLLQIQI